MGIRRVRRPMQAIRVVLISLTVGLAPACGSTPDPTCPATVPGTLATSEPVQGDPPNVLFLLLDDVGIDLVSAYGHPRAPDTPTLDGLAQEGIRFTQAYANPWCSPTRATILTGKHSRRLGIGTAIEVRNERTTLADGHTSLPEALKAGSGHTWSTALFGKWHLDPLTNRGVTGPARHGFDWHQGTLANLDDNHSLDRQPQSYWDWEQLDNGVITRRTGYATSATADDTLAWIRQAPSPWFAWVAFHAAHAPWHSPPDALQRYGDVSGTTKPERIRAVVQALDTEIGRLLAGLTPEVRARTMIVVMGDNGSPGFTHEGEAYEPSGKATVSESGTHVPLFVVGPLVDQPGTTSDALVQSTDLYATIAEIGGVDLSGTIGTLDSISFLPHIRDPGLPTRRAFVYTEAFDNAPAAPFLHHRRAIFDGRWRLRRAAHDDDLFDMKDAHYEGDDLVTALGRPIGGEAEAAWERLSATMLACDPYATP